MSRYRKVEVRTWGDEKFRKLSPMPPSGQGLWLYLMTGPHTTAIPGLSNVGRAALAEGLSWTQEAFDEAFAEVFRQGMVKADWGNRVVWIPKAIKHNQPASPNVVTSWTIQLDLIPECELKDEALHGLAAAMNPPCLQAFERIQAVSKGYGKASRKPSVKASPKPMPNQEQEQHEEQKEQETLALIANALPAIVPFITLPLNDGTEFSIPSERVHEWHGLYPAADVEQELRKYKGWADANPTRRKTRGGILRSVNAWLAKAHDSNASNRNGGVSAANRRNTSRGEQRLERQVEELAKSGVQFPTR